MSTTLHEVLEFIRDPNLPPGQRSLIIDALNAQVREKRREAKRGLFPGMRVQFYSNRSFRNVFGRITKVNRVNVDLVEEGTGTRWRVSPQLLKPVDAAGQPVQEDEF